MNRFTQNNKEHIVMAAKSNGFFQNLWNSTKTAAKRTVKPLASVATVGAGFGAGHGVRHILQNHVATEGGLNASLKSVSKHAPVGGAAAGALLAPIVADWADRVATGRPSVLLVRRGGEEFFVLQGLPHVEREPRAWISPEDGEIYVEGLRIEHIELLALSSGDLDEDDIDAEKFMEDLEAIGDHSFRIFRNQNPNVAEAIRQRAEGPKAPEKTAAETAEEAAGQATETEQVAEEAAA
jgi:hypothetical protein